MQSFEEKVEKYSAAMFRCAFMYCGNRQDAEDIVQEVFYKYIIKQPVFANEDHERAWLLRVTINMSKNYIRSFWRRNVESLREVCPCVSDDAIDIWEAVKQLPDRYRLVLELHCLEGYTLKEIADILKKKPSTIGTWYERAKKKLKKEIEEDLT
ncbi:MAG: RNA polymerase sigma factor [Lachnospiraceae bacterium]